MAKRAKEKWKTYQHVFDEFTYRNLFKLSAQGLFDGLKSPVCMGKEANIFSAQTDNDDVIVKIYRLETVDFKRMYEYIKFDDRYISMKRARRQIIFSWTQREYRNLMKAREAGIRVPLPLTFKHNIIVMEQIGHPEPAQQLKNHMLKDADKFFDEIIDMTKKLWKAGLVHGDLSQFNILVENDKPVFIDFSQGITTSSSMAKELLERDMLNICNYFKKMDVEKDPAEVVKLIIS